MVAPWCNLDGRQRAENAPRLSIVVSLPGRNSPLDEFDSSRAAPYSGPTAGGASIASPSRPTARIQYEVSTPRHSFRLVNVFGTTRNTTTGHDCLAVRSKPPTWGLRYVMSFLTNTASSRSSYLLHAPTLPRFNHLVDCPGTESLLPAAVELPRLADVVEMEFRSLVEVMCSTVLTRYVPSSRLVAVAVTCPSRFRGLEPTSRPLPVRAAFRGSATSLPSLTGKPSWAFHG